MCTCNYKRKLFAVCERQCRAPDDNGMAYSVDHEKGCADARGFCCDCNATVIATYDGRKYIIEDFSGEVIYTH